MSMKKKNIGNWLKKEYLSTSPSQTENLGRKLAGEILKKPSGKGAVVIGLIGELGGGKTTFLQGLAKGLMVKERVLSPSFILIRRFSIPKFKFFYHIDCYRIEKPKEILALGFKEIIANPKNIVGIEWAEKIKKILPKNTLILKFKFLGKNKRKISKETFVK